MEQSHKSRSNSKLNKSAEKSKSNRIPLHLKPISNFPEIGTKVWPNAQTGTNGLEMYAPHVPQVKSKQIQLNSRNKASTTVTKRAVPVNKEHERDSSVPKAKQQSYQPASTTPNLNGPTAKAIQPAPSNTIQRRPQPGQPRQATQSSSLPALQPAPVKIQYLYSIGPHNNPAIAQAAISNRPWWGPAPTPTTVNFYWRARFEVSYSIFDGGYRLINRFEKYFEVHEKDNLFRNMWFYARRRNLDIFDYIPLTFSFRTQEQNFFDDLQSFAKVFKGLAQGGAEEIPKIEKISTWTDKFGVVHPVYYDFDLPIEGKRPIPLPKNRFMNIAPEKVKIPDSYDAGKHLWMLKPSWMSRGRGLELFKSLDELSGLLKNYLGGYEAKDYCQMGYSDKEEQSPVLKVSGKGSGKSKNVGGRTSTFPTFVIQKYMEKPLLYKRFKFDIRMYACITQECELYTFR